MFHEYTVQHVHIFFESVEAFFEIIKSVFN